MDIIERQLRAYNAHDLDAFLACFSEDIVIDNRDGREMLRGKRAARSAYHALFATCPALRATVSWRRRFSEYVVDAEYVTGTPNGEVWCVLVLYWLQADCIVYMRAF